MQVTAVEVFDFLEHHEVCSIERYEIASQDFGALRRSVRQIVQRFRDSDNPETLELSDRLRALLSEWLTVPVPFDRSIQDVLMDLFGGAEVVQNRWGTDIRTLYDAALRAAQELPSAESPMRQKLRAVIQEMRSQHRMFRIYCHARARQHFESLWSSSKRSPLAADTFLHSVRDYRGAEPFDALIKVGPLRARGWGSAPDAILTAPRFGTLVQIAWSGCSDELDFGYDPVSPPTDAPAAMGARRGLVAWTKRVTRVGDDPRIIAGGPAESDELKMFREMDQRREKRSATLVQVDGEHGILYPPHSQVLSFDPDPTAREPIAHRVPGDTLVEGMFLIRPLVDDVDLGGIRAEHGHYSQIWKRLLSVERQRDIDGLISRLRKTGLNLAHLRTAIGHWCEPPTTVIHAPKKMRHFKILIEVLDRDSGGGTPPGHGGYPWWQLAWAEIRRSRGEAIQTGMQEQGIVREQLVDILQDCLPKIRKKAAVNAGFRLPIPEDADVHGEFLFFKVYGIETGFSIPEAEFRVVCELDWIEQWRD